VVVFLGPWKDIRDWLGKLKGVWFSDFPQVPITLISKVFLWTVGRTAPNIHLAATVHNILILPE
jgi:hypothetical protein